MFLGMCADTAMVRPSTFTPSIEPFSIPQAMVVSQVLKSGSSPTQHGHSTLQVQTSSSRPSISYATSHLPRDCPGVRVFGRPTDIGRPTEQYAARTDCQAPFLLEIGSALLASPPQSS